MFTPVCFIYLGEILFKPLCYRSQACFYTENSAKYHRQKPPATGMKSKKNLFFLSLNFFSFHS